MPKFPHVKVKLTGRDGNAMSIIAAVRHAMRKAGIPQSEITAYSEAAMSDTYDNLLRLTMETVEVS